MRALRDALLNDGPARACEELYAVAHESSAGWTPQAREMQNEVHLAVRRGVSVAVHAAVRDEIEGLRRRR